jgi:hypothetical protein
MSKERSPRKEAGKAPAMTPKEREAAKQAKQAAAKLRRV